MEETTGTNKKPVDLTRPNMHRHRNLDGIIIDLICILDGL